MEEESLRSEEEGKIEDLIDEVLTPEGGVLTGYIIIAEYIDLEGVKGFVTDNSSDMAPWTRDGLLDHVKQSFEIDEIADAVIETEGEDDDE